MVCRIWALVHVAAELGEDEDCLLDIIGEKDPEGGIIWVYGLPLGEDGTLAFTAFGVENLMNLIETHKADRG